MLIFKHSFKLDTEVKILWFHRVVRNKQFAESHKDSTKICLFQQESGGTVLSTNWKEIGEKKVEVKPPDGMEYKQWEY